MQEKLIKIVDPASKKRFVTCKQRVGDGQLFLFIVQMLAISQCLICDITLISFLFIYLVDSSDKIIHFVIFHILRDKRSASSRKTVHKNL